MLRDASYPGYFRMRVICGGYSEEEDRMTENAEFFIDAYFCKRYNIKGGLAEGRSLKEKRQRLLERIMKRDVPESAKAIDPVKLIREDRDR